MRDYLFTISDHDGDEITLAYDTATWEMMVTAKSYDDLERPVIVMLRKEDVLAMARFALDYDSTLREHKLCKPIKKGRIDHD